MVLISATPARADRELLGAGRPRGGARGRGQPRASPGRHRARGRDLVRRSAAEILVREAPDCVQICSRWGCASTPTASAVSRSGWRAVTRSGASSTPAAAPPGGASSVSCRRCAAADGDHGARGRARAVAVASTPPEHGRCRGLICETAIGARSVIARRERRIVLATGGAAALWARTTNPPGSQGVGLLLAHAAGARLADLELLQFHPTAVIGVRGREGFLVTEAIRGEGATLHDAPRRALRRRARPARRGLAGDPGAPARDRSERGRARHARDRPGAFPERRRGAARSGPRPDARARAGRAGCPLHDGRDRHGPAARSTVRGPVRGRGVLLHRPARRQPARVELAQRVLRVRTPRGRARAAEPAPPRAPASELAALAARRRRPAPSRSRGRRCGASGHRAHRRGPSPAAATIPIRSPA